MANEQAKFLQGGLFKHVAVMSFTASVGLMAVFFVDFVDMVFISMLGESELAAAIGYAGAILFFTTSLGIGMSIAAGALVARALGQGDSDLARSKATHTLFFGLVMGILLATTVWFNLDVLTGWVGAEGHTQALAISYLQIIIPSMPLMLAGMVASAILRGHGDARRAMFVTLWGGGVNAVLDPIFIFALGLGLEGAALASVAARVAMCVAGLVPVLRHYGGFTRISFDGLLADFKPVFTIALPAILTQMATPFSAAYVTRAMAEYGEQAVAGMAIVGRLTPLAFAVIFALSGAVGPIIGQNAGARQHDRVRGAFRDAMLFTACFVVAVAVVLFFLRGPIADLFSATGLTRDLVYLFCGPLALAYFFNGVLFVANAAFNNLGHPFYSTWVNWGRHTIGTVPFVIVFSNFWGPQGVLIGQAAGGFLFAVLAYFLALRVMAKQADTEVPKPETFQRQARLQSLFNLRR